MGKRFDFESIIIGGGITGKTAALALARAGQKVAIIEQDRWGGNEINYRDVPYAACLNFSHFFAHVKSANKMGLSGETEFDYEALSKWRDSAILKAGGNDKKELVEAGVTCIKGKARFLGGYDIAINEQKKASANKFLIATGSVLNQDGIAGTDTVKCLSPTEALRLAAVPKTIVVVGGGATGCELAQYFAELGSKVAILEKEEDLLPKEDVEVGQVLQTYFTKKLHIKVMLEAKVTSVSRTEKSPVVMFKYGGKEKSVCVETIILATGSKPNIAELGLKEAGVSFDKKGVIVDKALQTSARQIYAAGDVIGGESSTERSAYLAQLAAKNMLGKTKSYVNYDGFIRVTDIYPQVASTGMSEEELVRRQRRYKKSIVALSAVRVATTEDFNTGFVKILSDTSGKIVGATIVAPRAVEMIQPLAMAVRHGLTDLQIASTPYVTGSWSEAVKLAAKKLIK